MKTVIIKYNAGNIRSVTYALERLGITPILSDEPAEIQSADRVIFPGVGEASTAMNYLKTRGLDRLIPTLTQPFLGICLGLQLMCRHSAEGNTNCLNIFDVAVKKFDPTTPEAHAQNLKVPQMGWNALQQLKSPLFAGLDAPIYVYFVHSFYAELSPFTIAESTHIQSFSASLHRRNFYAVQFHPEKSSEAGSQILANFLNHIEA